MKYNHFLLPEHECFFYRDNRTHVSEGHSLPIPELGWWSQNLISYIEHIYIQHSANVLCKVWETAKSTGLQNCCTGPSISMTLKISIPNSYRQRKRKQTSSSWPCANVYIKAGDKKICRINFTTWSNPFSEASICVALSEIKVLPLISPTPLKRSAQPKTVHRRKARCTRMVSQQSFKRKSHNGRFTSTEHNCSVSSGH